MLLMRRTSAIVLLWPTMVACGGEPTVAVPVPSTGHGAPATRSAPSDCPLSAEDLADATAMRWELRDTMADHPLETLESVKATVCVFTASDSPQAGGDPLVLRVDMVGGADAAALRSNFEDTCTEYGGTVEAASPAAALCRRAGVIAEGQATSAERAVDVYLVNADPATGMALTPTFEKIITAVT